MGEPSGEPRVYFVLFKLARETDNARLHEVGPILRRLLTRWSRGGNEAVCLSNDLHLSGYFLKTTKPAGMMQAEFRNEPGVSTDDSMIVFEVGPDFGGSGFSRAWTFLQHNRR